MRVSRREFLKKIGAAGVAGSAVGLKPGRATASTPRPVSQDWTAVLVDLTKCNGCRQCEAACREVNGFAIPTKEELLDESVFSERRRLGPKHYTVVNRFPRPGNDGGNRPFYAKTNCLHCLDPACVSACLVGAMEKRPNGAVTYDAGKCMGCRYCMVACPFEMPTYEYENAFTPQVRKCSFCFDRDNRDRGAEPACVHACPKECLIYGKRSEMLALAHEKIQRRPDVYVDHVYGEHEAGGTSWLYVSGVPFQEIGFFAVGTDAAPRLSETIQHGVFKHFIPPVAWCAILGLSMWLTKPEEAPLGATAPDADIEADGDGQRPTRRTRKLEGVAT